MTSPPRALLVRPPVHPRGLDAAPRVAGALDAPKPFVAARRETLIGDVFFQRFVAWWLPVWILGALTVAQAYVIIRLVAARRPRGRAAHLVVLAWLGIAAAQAFAVIVAGVRLNMPAKSLVELVGFGVMGWVFGALAIAAGAAHRLYSPRVTRAVTWLGAMVLVLSLVAIFGRVLGLPELYISPAPLGMLFPHSTVARFYATAAVFIREDTLGEKMTRLILFFPWATALGLGGLGIFCISTRERSLVWRGIGMAGGAVGIVFSWSRIAIATWLAVSAMLAFLRAGALVRLAVAGAVLLGLFIVPLYGIDPIAELSGVRHSVDSARAGSSMARDLIYRKSYEGFLQSPWIGNGWIGESVHAKEELPIGSHSTIYGLLYTGGLPTFLAFAFAMLATLGTQLARWISERNDDLRARIEVGMALTIGLLAFSPFEQLFSLTLPCLFMLMWIGACVGHGDQPELALPAAPSAPRPRASVLHMGRRPAAPVGETARALKPFRKERKEDLLF